MSALAALLLCATLLPQGPSVLEVAGPEPAVVVFPEQSRIRLRLVTNERVSPPVLPTVDGLQFTLQGPSTQQRMYSDGFRTINETWVDWTVLVRPMRVGEFSIPPFDVPTGKGAERTPQLTLRAVKDIEGNKFGVLTMRVEPQRVYVQEPVRVTFEFNVDRGVKVTQNQASNGQPYLNIELLAPWLQRLEGAVSLETAAPDRGRVVYLVHDQRLLPTEQIDGVTRDGRPYLQCRLEKAYLPSRVGKLTVPAAIMGFDAETGQFRIVEDFFQRRRVPVTKTFYVEAPAVEVEVLPLPEEGRPSPFYGAVGRFTMDARADRERVRVGSSVKLIVSIRGAGNTEFLKIPELGKVEGFHALGTKERRTAGLVEVTYDLTPLEASTRELPAVRWNFFDTTPGVERFVNVETRPIPIAIEALPEGEGLATLPGEVVAPVVAGVDDIFDMQPLRESAPAPTPVRPERAVALLLLLAPWVAALGLATFLRRRVAARADVAGQRQRGARKAFARALGEHGPFDALVSYLADRLAVPDAAIIGPDLGARLRARGVEAQLSDEIVAAVEAGVAARYGGSGGVDAARAEQIVSALEAVTLRRAPTGALALLLAAALASSLGAQVVSGPDHVADGEAAYRRGDYAAAAAAFEAATAARDVDRRVFYNLGNARYRLGEFGRALAAYERARLGLPRDPQLAANLALVRRKLDLGTAEGEPFSHAVAALRDSLTPAERLGLALALHALAAGLLVLGGRRGLFRLLGGLLLIPGLLLAVELVWLLPARPPRAIVTAPQAELAAEPREGLAAVAKLRRGASVVVLGEGPTWTKVRAGDREGYLPAGVIEVVR